MNICVVVENIYDILYMIIFPLCLHYDTNNFCLTVYLPYFNEKIEKERIHIAFVVFFSNSILLQQYVEKI